MDERSKRSATNGDPMSQTPTQCSSDLLELNAVRVDLPQFDIDDVDTWILMCENLMLDAGITRQETKLRKLMAKLPPQCFRAVKHLVCQSPLAPDCYVQLTRCLRERFGLTHAERLQRLESLPPSLGDLKPSELFGQLQMLYPDDTDHPIVREHFLKRLSQPLRSLCREWLHSCGLSEAAVRADQHYPLGSDALVAHTEAQPTDHDFSPPQHSEDLVAATRFNLPDRFSGRAGAFPRRPTPHVSGAARGRRRAGYFIDRWCRIHQRYGPDARNCLGEGRRYLVDSGSEVSILPPDRRTSRTPACNAPALKAANGTRITVFAVGRPAQLDLGLGRRYAFTFLVADVPVAILGADFLRHHGLLPDLKSGSLRDEATGQQIRACGRRRADGRAIVQVSLDFDASAPPADGAGFRHFRDSKLFDALLDSPGVFPAVASPGVEHTIETHGRPVYARARRMTPDRLAAIKKELNELLRRGILVPSRSPWASPIHLVPKDKGHGYRMVGCYERLNAITVPDRYPIPDIQTFSDRLDRSVIFSKIDLARAYAQVKMNLADQPKTAIITPLGLYEYTRMPFGLRNSAQTFQRLMDAVLRGLPRVFAYIDDILVYSTSETEHQADLRAVFERLRDHGLTIRPEKCSLGQTQIDFLGFRISKDGLQPLPDKIRDLLDMAPLSNPAECRRFIGMVNYYHRFLPHIASVLRPLYSLADQTKRGFAWTAEHDAAFHEAKSCLAEAATLSFPRTSAPTQVIADASDIAVGAVIQQMQGNRWVPIAFHSKKLSAAQSKWSTGDKELFALFSAVRRFRYLLEGRPDLELCTDHKPLVHAFTSTSERSARVQRQLAFLSEFSTEIRHIAGRDNPVSDCLSRPSQTVFSAGYEVHCADFEQMAEEQRRCPEVAELAANHSLQIEARPMHGTQTPLLVDVSTGSPRPLVPRSLRRAVFDRFHGLHHPGIRATRRMLTERFVWRNISTDIALWCKACLRCQSSKVGRHQRTPLIRPPAPTSRFESLHVDIVGPLPYSRGYQYVFTVVDRFTRYPEAIPIRDSTASECARALLRWISQFGICLKVTSDRGRQFVSDIWRELCQLLGLQTVTTLAYEPQQNGLVERMHRDLKASLMAVLQGDPHWIDALPLVLMGMRASIKPDIGSSAAELVFGEAIRLPGQYFDRGTDAPNTAFVKGLRSVLGRLRPVPTAWHQSAVRRPVFISPALRTATHVFVRVDSYRAPLQPPYKGPYRVVERGPKSYVLELDGATDSVAIDRLKPAFTTATTESAAPFPADERHPEAQQRTTDPPPQPIATRSGRVSRRPARFIH